ncbi:MAG: ureidoglycolate lyase [bacterium]
MRTVKVRELTVEGFLPFGTFATMVNPSATRIGAKPVEFFRDMVQQGLGADGAASFSTCRVEKRALVVDVTEYHTAASEGILPLDNDVLIHVAPATPPDGRVPVESMAVFRVPKGTMVVIRPGVWHHAPFTVNERPANVLIVLPERAYANDCHVYQLKGKDRVTIQACC